jgi:hypothetical protein
MRLPPRWLQTVAVAGEVDTDVMVLDLIKQAVPQIDGAATMAQGCTVGSLSIVEPRRFARLLTLMGSTMLTGSDLLAKVKELGDASKSDLVRGCGYVSTKKDGTERLNFTAFYEALLEAKGMSLGGGGGRSGKRPGRQLSYATKVQFNGNLLVGKAYTAQLGLRPGDEFEIKLGKKQIRLVPLGGSDEDE